MVSKTLKKKVPAKKAKSVKAVPVVDSAKEIWFAGLGAFSVVQQEGEKLIGQGTKLFDKLVSEGARVEKESIDFVDSTVDEIKHDVEKSIKDVRKQANESWDNLGSVFDERVSGTLERLGIPTTKDLSKLSGRVQNMTRKATSSWKEVEKLAREATDNLGKFESEFTKRVKGVLESLHVPAMDDLDKLESSVEKRVSDTFGKLESTTAGEIKKLNEGVQDVSRQFSDNWGKLESIIEDRVKVVLGGLGIPSSDDISKLATELNKLSKQVADLDKKLTAKAKVAPKKPTAKKALTPKAATTMTVAEKKKAAEAISKMKPAGKAKAKS